MKFKTIAEAFNHYRTSTLEEIERRAAEIKNIVATDATADVDALNIELEGLSQAKQNVQSRAAGGQQQDGGERGEARGAAQGGTAGHGRGPVSR